MDAIGLAHRAMHCIVDGQQKRGRQQSRWVDNMKGDFKEMRLDVGEAIDSARDISRWRHIVTTSSSVSS